MSEPRVLFIDIDGTLVDYHGQLPASAATAISRARQAGHLVLLCSGRAKAEIPEELWQLNIDGYLGGNGNYVELGGEIVLENALSRGDTQAVVRWLAERRLEFYLECNAGLFASSGFAEAARPAMARYAQSKGRPAPAGADLGFHGMRFGESLDRADVMKISYLLAAHTDHLDAKGQFPHLQHGVWGGRGAAAIFGDIGVTGVTKAVAVAAALNHLGLDRSASIAFGDAVVDLPMFAACATKVAMGNAAAEVKRAADLVTADVEEDGLAKSFAALGLLGD